MTTSVGSVRFHQDDQALSFRVSGRGAMAHSLPLRRCAERFIAAGGRRLRVDLRDCVHLDSTFMGTLLTLKKSLDKQGGALTLVMPSAACAKLLQQMGLADDLKAEDGDDAPTAWAELPPDGDAAAFRQNVTQAHEELSRLPGAAGEQFKSVMRCLEQANKRDNPE